MKFVQSFCFASLLLPSTVLQNVGASAPQMCTAQCEVKMITGTRDITNELIEYERELKKIESEADRWIQRQALALASEVKRLEDVLAEKVAMTENEIKKAAEMQQSLDENAKKKNAAADPSGRGSSATEAIVAYVKRAIEVVAKLQEGVEAKLEELRKKAEAEDHGEH